MKKLKLLQVYLLPIVVACISILFFYHRYIPVASAILILYLIYNISTLNKFWDKDYEINKFTQSINNAISKNLCNLAIPVVLIKKSGEIIWYNQKFTEFKDDDQLIGKNIVTVIRGMNIDKVTDGEKLSHQRFKDNGKVFDIYGEIVSSGDEEYSLVCFNDITELVAINNTRESIMLIEADNLTEALEMTDEQDRPMVVAEVEKTINSYAHKMNAMVKKYDNNKYVLSVQDRYINDEIDLKFPILDEISSIDKGNRLDITLSIGIGRGGISPLENSNFATVAKELALGRGGDQVAIKNNEDIKFFGGNSKEVEKRTRVRARVVAHALKELIYESSKIYIVGHINPDMDCFGSAVALSSVIEQLGKKCNIILNDDTNPIDYFLHKLMNNNEEKYKNLFISSEEAMNNLDEETLIIIVDVHNRSYTGNLELVEKSNRRVIIDHHRRSPNIIEGALLNYIEVYASSTSEMITEIIQYMIDKPKLTPIEAEGLLAGIYMDTKGFAFKTGVRTFEAASFLRQKGADTFEVKKAFTDNLDDYLLIAETIKSAEVDKENNTAIAVCPDNVDTVIVAKAADEMLNISGILVCFVLANINGDIYISGRSVGDINVQVVLEAMGGGGHMNIAGAKISGITIEEVIEKLKESIKKHLRVGD